MHLDECCISLGFKLLKRSGLLSQLILFQIRSPSLALQLRGGDVLEGTSSGFATLRVCLACSWHEQAGR